MDSQNPFAPRPPACRGGFGRGVPVPTSPFHPMSAPTAPPALRPGAMHDPLKSEVAAVAINNVGMEGLMKNGEVVPVFAKPNGDWNKT
eukprot:4031464-Pyramimonas_sp.AAC.1